jgi:hypothetical protein
MLVDNKYIVVVVVAAVIIIIIIIIHIIYTPFKVLAKLLRSPCHVVMSVGFTMHFGATNVYLHKQERLLHARNAHM